ncbi:SMI1/KNR4 family protein [Actinomadura craniellae]|uniref:SMI1/KNR4 family protein n=1 Tax=Actinomadura craniellae TaxID=2231787 RepID=A0A365HDZ6_9ACTN|nr:SMI1/KNR4 family protein [Actinomadura craniellae]RAY17146.1 SMI1/KNR4 family protein [Actinomadura craniellae]
MTGGRSSMDARIAELLDELARSVHREAPGEWSRGLLSGNASAMSYSYGVTYDLPDGTNTRVFPKDYDVLAELADAVAAAHGWRQVHFEVACAPSGEVEATAFHGAVEPLVGGEGHVAVLDPGYLPAEPGLDQEGPGNAVPAGDPETATARLREYLRRFSRLVERSRKPAPAASPAEIERAEQRLGARLPADLRALYEIADGDRDAGIFDGSTWLPLDEVVRVHERTRERDWFGWELGWDKTVRDTDPPDTVRRCTGHPAWIPFAHDHGGNYLAADLAPARAGRPGQIIRIGRDYGDGPGHVADSVTTLLGDYLDMLDRGDYSAEPDYLELLDDRPPRAVAFRILGPEEGPLDRAELAGSPGLQHLNVNQAGEVDLSALAAVPGLRALHLNRPVTADLAPLRGLPLERLRVTLSGGDLAPLDSHPTLRSLSLATAGGPVRISPLRTVPLLHGLDLSGADVADLDTLADLPGLRYLALRPDQWAAFVARPPALAAVCVKGATPLPAVIDWAAGLGLDVTGVLRRSGRVPPH